MNFRETYLESALFEFNRYKSLGDKTFDQLTTAELYYSATDSDNSIALIIKHMAGNMRSRWTHFFEEDGEKKWRDRDTEFQDPPNTREEVITLWESGWQCLFNALSEINATNFDNMVRIRNEEHTVIAAINRQLAHYAHHVGQIVLLGKQLKGDKWQSLSIPKGSSEDFNNSMFGNAKR